MFKQKLKSEKRLIEWLLPQGTSLKLTETIPRWVVCRCNLDWGCLSPPARRQSGITQKEHGEKSGKPLFVVMLEREAKVMELLVEEGLVICS